MDTIANATPVLTSALDEVVPGWRSMDRAAFDAWRRDIPKADAEGIRLFLARALLETPPASLEELDGRTAKAALGADRPEKNLLNEALQPLWGEGPDSFFLNEHFDEGKGTWSFATLREYDEADHEFQERCRAEDTDGEHAIRPYLGRMLWDWARWIEDGRLVYGNLSVAALRLSNEMDELASERVDLAFPTKRSVAPAPDDAPAPGAMRSFVASRLPADVAALARAANRACWTEIARLNDERWAPHFASEPAWAINEADFREHERDRTLTFSGPAALDRVRPASFLADLAALPDGTSAYAEYADGEKVRFVVWLEDQIDRVRMQGK